MLWFGNVLWPNLILCTVLYLLDYYLTIAGARVYRAGAQQTIIFEGSYELTPGYQRDVDQLRWVSRRFIWSLVRMLGLVSLTWWLTIQLRFLSCFLCILVSSSACNWPSRSGIYKTCSYFVRSSSPALPMDKSSTLVR
ncbi:MAG TPA: hypothetical protein VI488_21235 [Candidatus Angelobacter sp.]